MDYQAFFSDVVAWIGQANQMAVRLGMGNVEFWTWAAESSSQLCKKYGDNRLVVKQMVMLIEYLEEMYETRKAR